MESVLIGESTGEPAVQLLDQAFQLQVGEHGSQPALMTPDAQLTFNEFDQKSSQLANALHQRLQGSMTAPVIVAMSPSLDRFVAILALLKLKIPYVPVETSVPRNRIKIIIREARPSCIIFDDDLETAVNREDVLAEAVQLVPFRSLSNEGSELQTIVMKANGNADSLACILYTSGSTGLPKGVKLTHGNIMTRLAWQWRELPFNGTEVGMAKTSLLFVDSITESWSFLLQGRPLVVVTKDKIKNPELLVSTLINFSVARLLVVPSLLQSILTYLKISGRSEELTKLDMVICSGESLPAQLARKFFQVFENGKLLVNLYGSTEITGDGTCDVYTCIDDVIRKTTDGAMSIGRPLDNVTIQLVDDNSKVVPLGEVGEIWLRGPTVMQGYVNSEQNENALVQDEDCLWYRTGDYGKIVDDVIVYQGRRDSQVKVRGNRVNMAEIEKTILELKGVDKTVVLLIDDNIVAFCATNNGLTEREIKEKCGLTLPEYMIPQVHLMPQIPLTESTGKMDRVKLREIYKNRSTKKSENDSETETSQILTIIAQGIGLEQVELSDNFYDLGGNSINIVQVAGHLDDREIKLDFQRFLKAKTIDEMLACTRTSPQSTGEKLRVVPLDENSPENEAIELAAEAFSKRELLTALCQVDRPRFVNLLQTLFYPHALKSGVSALFYRNEELVGVLFNIRKSAPIEPGEQVPEMELLLEVLHQTEALLDNPSSPDETLEMVISASKDTLTGTEKLFVMHEMEVYTLEKATELGYTAVCTINTSAVTRSLARQLGYETKGGTRAKDYTRPDGSKPFLNAPEEAYFSPYIKFLDG